MSEKIDLQFEVYCLMGNFLFENYFPDCDEVITRTVNKDIIRFKQDIEKFIQK